MNAEEALQRQLFEESVRGDLMTVAPLADLDTLVEHISANPHLTSLLSAAREAGREEGRAEMAAEATKWAHLAAQACNERDAAMDAADDV